MSCGRPKHNIIINIIKDVYFIILDIDDLKKDNILCNYNKNYYKILEKIIEEIYDYKNVKIKKDENGKPYVLNYDIKISISHKNKYLTFAMSNVEIGIDIEELKEFNHLIMYKFFHKDEIQFIRNGYYGDLVKFYYIWTRKEAFVKSNNNYKLSGFSNFNVINMKNKFYTYIINNYMISIYKEN